MPTLLTPLTLKELEEILWNSRRSLSSVYREWRVGATVQEMALQRAHEDLKKIKDSISALRVLFGRESLPRQGKGRQQAINEASYILNSDHYLSVELQDHLEKILFKAEKTNIRRNENYESPLPPKRSVYTEARLQSAEGDESGVYIVSKTEFIEASKLSGATPLIKIGWSNSIWDRLSGLQTWEPDPIEILRIFPCANANTVEAKLHICLDTLGLGYDNGGGKEWFHVELPLIDNIAAALGLENKLL